MSDDSDAGADAATADPDADGTVTRRDPTDVEPTSEEHPDEGEGVFGEAVPAAPVEPGTPSIENAAFVVLGVASTVALILHLVSLLG